MQKWNRYLFFGYETSQRIGVWARKSAISQRLKILKSKQNVDIVNFITIR